MQIEKLFIKRTKELPSDATTSGHKLALKGGYIHQTGAGLYTYSPLGFKVLQNIEKIIREELDSVGCQEMNMPVVSPLSLWKETGRENIDVLLKFKTRAGIDAVVNPTHEEIVTDYVRSILQSYKQLPSFPNSLCLYQIQTKYRDELRARAGLIRCREFMMKDAYSFHRSWEDLNSFYDILLNAYHKIYNRLGLKNVIDILAPTGDMGGKISHEFQMVSEIGEDTIYTCSSCDYRANKEVLTDKEAEDILVCPKCGKPLVYKMGKNGQFIGCSDYPRCDYVQKEKKVVEETGQTCPVCGSPLVYRNKNGKKFVACSNYPTCKYTVKEEKEIKPVKKCPHCEDGFLIKKKGRYGYFLGCTNYPKCEYMEKIHKKGHK